MNTPGTVYKLHDTADPLGPIGLMMREPSVQTNRGRMSALVTLSREAEDRSGDVVVLKGMRLDGHQKNPVTLLDHNRKHVVGYCQDQLGAYTVKTVGDRLVGEVFFCQDSQLGLDTFRAVEARILRGTSIGFLPMPGKVEKRHQRGAVYHESNLIETTITPIGDNEDAVIEAVHKTFGKKPPVPELAALLPGLDYRPALVPSGWDADAVHKANTYKTAEPKDCVAQTRSGTYYTCPHCGEEMTHEGIFREEDGTTRHGACRGAVVLKEPEHVLETVPPAPVGVIHSGPVKSARPHAHRFLPGLRRKAMPGYDDATATDDFAPDAADDEFLPDDDLDSGMKAGAEFNHGLHDLLTQALAFIEDGRGTLDNATALKTAEKVSKWVEKALGALHDGHSAYLGEHPDQPQLPGAEGVTPGDDDDEDDEDDDADLDMETDADDDDIPDDLEDGKGESEGGDDSSAKKKPKKKKGKPFGKALSCEVRTKALNAYWEGLKRQAVAGDGPVVRDAVETLLAVAKDKAVTRSARIAANEVRKSLEGLLAPKAPGPGAAPSVEWTDDDWARAAVVLNGAG